MNTSATIRRQLISRKNSDVGECMQTSAVTVKWHYVTCLEVSVAVTPAVTSYAGRSNEARVLPTCISPALHGMLAVSQSGRPSGTYHARFIDDRI